MAEVRVKARKESVFAERFGVFAECLLTGVWIAVASVGVVTYAAAFAAGARHLRRRTTHEGGGWREFVGDFRTALRRGWAVGLAGWVAVGLVWVDVQAVRAGLPGGPLVGAAGLFALIGAAVAGLRATAVWEPGRAGGRCSRPPVAVPSSTPPDPSCSSAEWSSSSVPPCSSRRSRSPSWGPSRRPRSPWRSGTGVADGRRPSHQAGARAPHLHLSCP